MNIIYKQHRQPSTKVAFWLPGNQGWLHLNGDLLELAFVYSQKLVIGQSYHFFFLQPPSFSSLLYWLIPASPSRMSCKITSSRKSFLPTVAISLSPSLLMISSNLAGSTLCYHHCSCLIETVTSLLKTGDYFCILCIYLAEQCETVIQ